MLSVYPCEIEAEAKLPLVPAIVPIVSLLVVMIGSQRHAADALEKAAKYYRAAHQLRTGIFA